MSRETEKFNRALQKFMEDNPDLDFNQAKEDFIKLYNSGEYKLEDDYSKADELYEKALELEDAKLVIDALKKALDIYPKHYEAKGELIALEAKTNEERITRFKSLLNENRDDLENNHNINFKEFERTLWLDINCRPYLRNLFKLMTFYNNDSKFADALEIGKELIRLDPENHQDQNIFYLSCLLGLKRYADALNDANAFFKIGNQSKYLFVSFLASMYMHDNAEALKYAKEIAKYNNSYLCLMIGVVNLSPEDYQQIFSNPYVPEESLEEAARIFFAFNKIIYENMDQLNVFIDSYGTDIVSLIDPTPKGMELLFIMENKREATLKEIVSSLRGIDSEMDFAKIKDLSEDDVRKELIKLKNKKYLDYYESKYYMSYLGHSVLYFLVGEEK